MHTIQSYEKTAVETHKKLQENINKDNASLYPLIEEISTNNEYKIVCLAKIVINKNSSTAEILRIVNSIAYKHNLNSTISRENISTVIQVNIAVSYN